MASFFFLTLSLAFQFAAAAIALRLIPVSGVRLPWLLLSAAMLVRFFRENVTLWLAVVHHYRLSLFEESLALAVSALLLLGTILIKPIFLQLREALSEREELLEKARRARRRSDEERLRLRTVINHLPVGIFIMEADGRIAEVNEAANLIWGGKAPLSASVSEYGIYKGWWADTGEPIQPEEWAVARAIQKGETSLGESIDIERLDGSRGTILNSAVPIRSLDGEILGAVGVNQDITELRHLQQELEKQHRQARQQAAELETVFQAIPEGLITYSHDGRIVRHNPAAERITGFDRESWDLPVQERWRRVCVEHPDGTRLESDEIPTARAIQGEEVKGAILVFRPEENRRIVVSLSAAPVRFDNDVIGVVSIFSDITAVHELQEQLSIFVQMLSHDLRAPLTIIQGHAQLLLEAAAAEESSKSLNDIVAACQRMTRMMEDLLDEARLEHGQLSIEAQPIVPGLFLTTFLQQHALLLEMERVRLSLPENLPAVQADPAALERILANLLINALKYSSGAVRLSACRYANEVRFSVADRGKGMNEDDLSRIFDRFFRSSSVAGTKGLGLGLYISRLLVESNGGRIWALSRPDRGAVFFFTLPVAPR